MSVQSSLLFLSTVSACIATQSLADSCLLQPTCAPETACEKGDALLEWTAHAPQEFELNGVSFAVHRITEGTIMDTIKSSDATWKIISKGPALLIREPGYIGSISQTKKGESVTVNLVKIPTKFVDYADVVKRRRTFSGECEGLF